MDEIKTNKFSVSVKVYTGIVALLPVLSIYSSGIPGISVGELLLIIFLFYSIFIRKRSFNKVRATFLIIFGWYIVMATSFSLLFDSSQIGTITVRTTRYCFYLFVVLYLSRKFFSIEYAYTIIKCVSVVATVYIIFQYVCYEVLGILYKGYIPFIPLYTSGYETIDYSYLYETSFYRPTSFFLEPAHYSQYVLIGLVIYLFHREINLKDIFLASFLMLGILFSTSGQGLIIGTIIWLIYIIHIIFPKKIKKKYIIPIMILIGIGWLLIPILLSSDVVENSIERILYSGTNSAVSGRTQGYITVLSEDNMRIKLLGAGFGNTPSDVWFSGIAYFLYCSGIIGSMFLLIIFLRYYIKSKNKLTKMLILLSVSLSISAEMICSYWVVLIFSFICYSDGLNNKKVEV